MRVDKNKPAPEWIEALRHRYPCEPEIDRVQTRRLQRRAGPPFTPVSIETLTAGTKKLLTKHLGNNFEISNSRWLSGGASKLQMAFDLTWDEPGVGRTKTPLVLRMQPSEAISETSRLREFQTIRALEGYLPVPKAYWVDAEGEYLPHPAIIYTFVRGSAKPTLSKSQVTGVGTFMPPEVRPALGKQFVEHLAKLHTFDWRHPELTAFGKPASYKQAIEWHLNWWERVWESDINEDVPLMRLAAAWLRQNIPESGRLSLVHGDYRVGNFLFTEPDLNISAWLDWELAYIGDRHEDLAWCSKAQFGHADENGKPLVGGLVPRDEFFANYERISGLPVDPQLLRYFEILCSYKSVVITLASGCRVGRNSKSHQDILVLWLGGISYPLLDDLRVQLEGVL